MDGFMRYTLLFYYAMLTLFQNELGPINNIEFGTINFCLILSIFFNALIFSDIFVIWEIYVRDSIAIQEHLDEANELMDFVHISEDL